jgi:hypothetical protein
MDQMYITLAGHNTNRYVFGIYCDGTATSDIYLEAWDDNSFSTTNIELLTGTTNSSNNSFVNAIRTTASEPPWGPGWSGTDSEATYLRGDTNRIGLAMHLRLQTRRCIIIFIFVCRQTVRLFMLNQF